jgi:sulfofructose kinase
LSTGQDAGGPVVAALSLLTKLGHDCTLTTTIGKDKPGLSLRRIIKKQGIALQSQPQVATKVNTIVVDAETGQRQKIHSRVKHAPLKNLDPAFVRSFDLIIVDRHERQAFYEVVKHKNPEAKLIIDPSTEVSSFTLDMMRYADHPIVPIETVVQISEGRSLLQSVQTLQRVCGKTLIVTMGRFGSLVHDGSKLIIVPAMVVETVNANGAGDVYRGAFAFGQLQGWPITKCAEFANAAAALQCTKLGNATAVPSLPAINHSITEGEQLSVNLPLLNDHFTKLCQELRAPLTMAA